MDRSAGRGFPADEREKSMPQPYRGKEPYLFVSYAHRDRDRVLPVIRQLQTEGYRVWYDQGIDPGTEWDENIASHIEDSGYVLAFISANYLDSDNCKDELNYARTLERPRILIYLENVRLPGGMAMRLGRLQAVYAESYPCLEALVKKLGESQNIGSCRDPRPCPAEPESRPGNQPAPAVHVQISREEKGFRRILFSTLGRTDPVWGNRDASMLHIARHYRPDGICWAATPQFLVRMEDPSDGRYRKAVESLRQQIPGYDPTVMTPRAIDPDILTNVEACVAELSVILGWLRDEYPEAEILLNGSTGNAWIDSAMKQLDEGWNFNTRLVKVNAPPGAHAPIPETARDSLAQIADNRDALPGAPNRCYDRNHPLDTVATSVRG